MSLPWLPERSRPLSGIVRAIGLLWQYLSSSLFFLVFFIPALACKDDAGTDTADGDYGEGRRDCRDDAGGN
jgi:hypothetical protein